MKNWNKHYLILRIISLPIKLLFQITWGILLAILQSFHWLKFGSQELLYGKDNGKFLIRIIDQNEKLINLLSSKEKEETCCIKNCEEPVYNLNHCMLHWNIANEDN